MAALLESFLLQIIEERSAIGTIDVPRSDRWPGMSPFMPAMALKHVVF